MRGMTDAQQRVKCPACSAPSTIVKLGPLRLDLCSGCSGLWFDRGKLKALGSELSNEELAADLTELRDALYKGSERTGKIYLRCPACDEPMQRRAYSVASGVQVVRCDAHGTWLDRLAASRLVRLLRGEGDAELRALEAEHRPAASAEAELDASTRLRLVLDVFGFV